MAITFDSASGTSFIGLSGSYNQTIGVGTNRALIVGVVGGQKTATVSTLTYAGQSLTKASGVQFNNLLNSELWYLINPASGNNTVSIVTANSYPYAVGSISLFGVQGGQVFSVGVSGTGPGSNGGYTVSGTITTFANNDLLFDFIGIRDTTTATITVGSGQTLRVRKGTSGSPSNQQVQLQMSTKPASVFGTYTMTETTNSSDSYTYFTFGTRQYDPPNTKPRYYGTTI